jgi:hypothetical protein
LGAAKKNRLMVLEPASLKKDWHSVKVLCVEQREIDITKIFPNGLCAEFFEDLGKLISSNKGESRTSLRMRMVSEGDKGFVLRLMASCSVTKSICVSKFLKLNTFLKQEDMMDLTPVLKLDPLRRVLVALAPSMQEQKGRLALFYEGFSCFFKVFCFFHRTQQKPRACISRSFQPSSSVSSGKLKSKQNERYILF